MKSIGIALAAAMIAASPAFADTPGEADEIYGARAEYGAIEMESRYHTLTGGPDAGEGSFKLETEYGVNGSLRVAVNGEFDRDPGGPREASSMGFEAIYTVAVAGPLSVAAYAEYGVGFNGNRDELEGKAIIEYERGPFDARLNLIADKDLGAGGGPVIFGYTTRITTRAIGEVHLGIQAFGDLGSWHHSFPGADHFVGPSAFIPMRIGDGADELHFEAGYLFAVGRTRDDTDGQARVAVELEF